MLCSAGGSPCDFDKLNISVVSVGGKSRLGPFVCSARSVRNLVAASDCRQRRLTGDSLATFKAKAQIAPTCAQIEQRKRLREVGVAVLSDGEIEDYYPIEALADLVGETPEAMQQRIETTRTCYEMPEGIGFVEAVISQHQQGNRRRQARTDEQAGSPLVFPDGAATSRQRSGTGDGSQTRGYSR